jgi:hypothetical protein
MNLGYLILLICLFLAVFTVWKEYTRDNKLRAIWRIMASLLAVAALACIALPVKYKGTVSQTGKNEAMLLTDGFSRDSLNNYKTDSLYTAEAAIKNEYPKTKLVTLDELKWVTPGIKRLHVLGYGLNAAGLKQLDSIPIVFHPVQPPDGITAVNWTGRLKQGQPLIVQGSFKNTAVKKIRLILKGLNTTVDSVLIPAKATVKFNLTAVPKTTGRLVYQLLTITGKDTAGNESLPVTVDQDKPLKILMLSSAPNFENRFLKNWLSENGFAVSARLAISKGKFNSAYINMEQIPLDHLTPALLSKFDVLIGDLSVLAALNNTERSALKQQVTQKGLGLIVNADTTFKPSSWLQSDFQVQQSTTGEQKPIALLIGGKKIAPKLLITNQSFINDNGNIQQLVTDARNRLMAGTKIAGAGKLVFTTLTNTYTWMLAGNKNDYSTLWSLIISKAAMALPQTELWQAEGIPVVNEPVKLQVETAANTGQLMVDDVAVSPKQNSLLPFQWPASWWPSVAGWHTVKKTGGVQSWLYVNKTGSWKTIVALSKTATTKKYAEAMPILLSVTKEIQHNSEVAVPKIYFYIVLLAGCIFLWVESKISN